MDLVMEIVNELMPFLRTAWVTTVMMGIALLILAVVLNKNPERKKSPWIAGSFGTLMVISSGLQLIVSFL